MQGTILPNDYFLIRDSKDGMFHWYKGDPFRCQDRTKLEVGIEEVITSYIGTGTIANPVVVCLNCALLDRSVKFDVRLLSGIRNGSEEKHFEDMNGNVIDVLEVKNSDAQYPLSGAVFNNDGDVIEIRKYSFEGVCSDGKEEHCLVAVNGRLDYARTISISAADDE